MHSSSNLDRRTFLKLAAATGLSTSLPWPSLAAAPATRPRRLVKFPQKTDLIFLTDRPPNLEMPVKHLATDLTPNDAFFVRWHLSAIPTAVDPETFHLKITGHVNAELSLSLADLRSGFEPVSVHAVCQCAGNSRALFEPRVAGAQWNNGAVGNAKWTGVRLKDLLAKAGVKAGAVDVSFLGLDRPPLPDTPAFIKSLDLAKTNDDNVLVAYQMNDADLPLLNGYPLRLIVPGWYATYWIKSLEEIRVWPEKFKGFWMDKGYRIPNNPTAAEDPKSLATDTVPITTMSVRSLFALPAAGSELPAGKPIEITGVAFDGGTGIKSVELSTDGGQSWTPATLDRDLGPFSFRRWTHSWTPTAKGPAKVMARATANSGETQPTTAIWNRSGYRRNVIEQLDLTIV